MGNYLKFRPDGTAVGLLALLVAVVLAFSLLMPGRFFSGATFTSVAFQLPELGLLTLAMFIPILSGGLNLCIIASANLTSLLMAWLFISYLPPDAGLGLQALWLVLALAAAMLLAVMIGAVTGALVAYVGAHPILVTLATMTTVNGIGIYLTRGAALSGMPEIVRFIGAERVLGVPVPLWIFLAVAVLLALFLQKTRLGKCIYMSGSNINATHFSGVNTHRVLIAIYTLSSLLCVIAGLVMMARFNSARMGYGDSYLLLTVLAIILGGTDPFGGFGRVSGVVLSLVVLQVIATGLNLMNVSPHFSLAMWGAVLIAVLALKFFRHRYRQRRAMRRSAAWPEPQRATDPFPFAQDNANEIPDFAFTDVHEPDGYPAAIGGAEPPRRYAAYRHHGRALREKHHAVAVLYRTDPPAHLVAAGRASDGGEPDRFYRPDRPRRRGLYLPARRNHQPRRVPRDQPDPRAGQKVGWC